MAGTLKSYVIGLDIGTSSLKLVVFNLIDNKIQLELKKSTQEARISNNDNSSLHNEQHVGVILELIQMLFVELPSEYYERLQGIQICGQMHGIVLWNTETKQHSNLITWQDARCTPEFLSNLPVKSLSELNAGYGCATLFWLRKFGDLTLYNSAGTIQDYVTFLLAKNQNYMSDHNALSWGYFDMTTMEWQEELKKIDDFPFKMLPEVKRPGFKVSDSIHIQNLRLDTSSIFVALGDIQCSFYSCAENDTDCVINVSTSSQLCMAIDVKKYESLKSKLPSSISVFPYIDDKVLLVSASLNGGNVLDNFIEMLIDWNSQLGFVQQQTCGHSVEEQKNIIWRKLIEIATSFLTFDSKLVCRPRLFAERHDKTTFASMENIFSGNNKLGPLFVSICNGLVTNLDEMFPRKILIDELNCKRIVATGSGVLKNPILKYQLERVFKDLPIVYKESSDSAVGAAMYLKDLLKRDN